MTASRRVGIAGADFDLVTHAELIRHVVRAIRDGRGGTIVTPNLDICHRIRGDPASRALVASASLVVPDGMPLLWASRLAGCPLAERITGADLIFSLTDAAERNGWRICLIGGLPGSNGQRCTASLAADRLAAGRPGLAVAGAYAPPARFDAARDDIGSLRTSLLATRPHIVFVGLGFPKQEQLIARLAPDLRGTWFVGCGAAISYAAGRLRRAPAVAQRAGLEWAFRLISEPRRLASRYLGRDLPFAAMLLVGSAAERLRRDGPSHR